MILGLTGAYCSGKSEAASILTTLGWTSIDVDALGHQALASSLPEVVRLLGPVARRPDGLPDRRAIGRLVFADKTLLARFEAVVHPLMFALTDQAIAKADGEGEGKVCLNAAILYRMPQLTRCKAIIEIRASLPVRIRRGKTRDGLSTLRILQRILNQQSLWRQNRRPASGVIFLRNDGDKQQLSAAIKALSGLILNPTR